MTPIQNFHFQKTRLIDMVSDLVAQNGGSHYTNEMFKKAEEQFEQKEKEKREKIEKEKQEMINKAKEEGRQEGV